VPHEALEFRLRLDDGREGDGYAAEALGAKWFDKNPTLTIMALAWRASDHMLSLMKRKEL